MASTRTSVIASIALAAALGACDAVPFPAGSTSADDDQGLRPAGQIDAGLAELDARAVMRAAGGEACVDTLPDAIEMEVGHLSAAWSFSCPRLGAARDAWFVFADAWEASLAEAGATTPTSGSTLGDAGAPLHEWWTLTTANVVGSSRVVGVNGPASIEIIVTLDLVAP